MMPSLLLGTIAGQLDASVIGQWLSFCLRRRPQVSRFCPRSPQRASRSGRFDVGLNAASSLKRGLCVTKRPTQSFWPIRSPRSHDERDWS